MSARRPLVIVTGLSGAGLSTALRALEDLGYETVDNLRLSLVPTLLAEEGAAAQPLALRLYSRTPDFNAGGLARLLEDLQARSGLEVRVLYLDCSEEALLRRFQETRRPHPLAEDRAVTTAIRDERRLLAPLHELADVMLDTTLMQVPELRRCVVGHFRLDAAQVGLQIFVTSFAYRHGLPREADLIVDARFLQNPHWQEALRPLTGLELPARAYIEADAAFAPFVSGLMGWLLPLLPRYADDGRSFLTLAIGCTGGRHRSVLLAETIGTLLAGHGYVVGIGHRDLER